MKKYKQTIFGNGDNGKEPGNCFATCIAAVLEIPQEDTPNFVAADNWFLEVNKFLEPYGYSLIILDADHDNNYLYHSGYLIAAGQSSRGLRHCVVYHKGEPVLDPHPDNTFLENVDRWYLFAALQPEKQIIENAP